VFHASFFWFVDVPFWLPLGIFAGIVGQFIPTIGTYIGVALPALFTLLANPLSALWIVIFATVYQQIENYVFTPRISQRTMDVHPAVALGAVIAGAAIWGPIGALIGIPIAAVALAILDTFSKRHELLPELADLGDEGEEPAQRSDRAAAAEAD
jgi:predicted PurR-regulated permease PerM